MLVLNKKKLSFIVSGLFLIIFAFLFVIGKKEEYEIPTVSLPISGKCIVLDAGHGIPDERSCLLTLKITLIFYKK